MQNGALESELACKFNELGGKLDVLTGLVKSFAQPTVIGRTTSTTIEI